MNVILERIRADSEKHTASVPDRMYHSHIKTGEELRENWIKDLSIRIGNGQARLSNWAWTGLD